MFRGLSLDQLVEWMNGLPPEMIWGANLFICFASILLMLRVFGAAGIYVYIAVAVVCSNILVLKAVKSSLYHEPIALGTVLFTSTFLCTDILTEYYGPKAAREGVYIGIVGMLLTTLFMLVGMGFQPLDPEVYRDQYGWAIEHHEQMKGLFLPAPVLLISGMLAFLISQLNDVWIYNTLKKLTKGNYLWLRNNGSTAVSALLDNIIFSVLAWVVFVKEPMAWGVLWFTYILGTYWVRLIVAFLDTPIMYLSKYFVPKENFI